MQRNEPTDIPCAQTLLLHLHLWKQVIKKKDVICQFELMSLKSNCCFSSSFLIFIFFTFLTKQIHKATALTHKCHHQKSDTIEDTKTKAQCEPKLAFFAFVIHMKRVRNAENSASFHSLYQKDVTQNLFERTNSYEIPSGEPQTGHCLYFSCFCWVEPHLSKRAWLVEIKNTFTFSCWCGQFLLSIRVNTSRARAFNAR